MKKKVNSENKIKADKLKDLLEEEKEKVRRRFTILFYLMVVVSLAAGIGFFYIQDYQSCLVCAAIISIILIYFLIQKRSLKK